MNYPYIAIAFVLIVCFGSLITKQAEAVENRMTSPDGHVFSSLSTKIHRFRRNVRSLPPDFYFHFKANQTNRLWVLDATNFTCGQKGFCDRIPWTGRALCSFECWPQCKCDDQCTFFGDCCPDRLFQNSSDVPSLASPYVSCLNKNWTKWGNFSSVLMVDSCPTGSEVSRGIVKKCEKPDNSFQEEATPVMTIFGNITYRNKFCAQCHGKMEYEGWRHQVTCEDGTKLKNARSKDELWQLIINSPENCQIQTFPPDGFPARQCEGNFISQCNVTGKWEKYDPIVQELCDLYDHHVQYYGSTQFYKAYKNVFCAVCNGAELIRHNMCLRAKDETFPYPLSVLLDFNPVSKPTSEDSFRMGASPEKPVCSIGQVFDPFTKVCRQIICPEKRVLDGDSCTLPYSASNGLGVRFSALLRPANDSVESIPYIVSQEYVDALEAALDEFNPFIVYRLNMAYFSVSPFGKNERQILDLSLKVLVISGEVISLSSKSIVDLETTLWSFLSTDWSLFNGEENVTLSSSPRLCGSSEQLEGYILSAEANHQDSFIKLYHDCDKVNCENKTAVYPLSLDCPFLEYNVSEGQNFTYNVTGNFLDVENLTVFLNKSEVLYCGQTLRLCLVAVSYIEEILVEILHNSSLVKPSDSGKPINFGMAIVSLVCITLSLIGLVLTFIVYSFVPKLRSLPGLNTMAMVFNLFCAQLLFLIGSNRTENTIACKGLGVCIHFFWMATFVWMGISAFHMHSVFSKLRPMSNLTKENKSRHYKYWALCFVTSVTVVFARVLYSLVRSDWEEIGYGGQICFINDPIAIGIFFAGPLGLILLMNGLFFIFTVIAIQRVPNMSETSNKSNKHHLFVYIKLSLLFGFTWIFGILAAIFTSEVLWYIFIVLTGTQGLLLFVAYCANKRTLDMLKSAFKEHRGDRSSTQCDKSGKYQTNITLTAGTSFSNQTSSSKSK